FVAFLPQFLNPAQQIAPQVIVLGILYIAIAVAIDSTYVLTAAAISGRLIQSPLAQRRTGRAAAATYLALGLATAASGFRKPEAPDDADYQLLEHTFKFHPLTIEDIRHQDQRPKVDEYADYNFTVIFVAVWENDDIALREHHLFVGPHYLITVHHEPSTQLKDLQERIHKSPELTHGKPAFLTYLAIDALVDATFPVLDNLDEEVDKLEDEITEKATQESLSRIYHLKHAVSQLRRFLGTQRDVFQSLITHGIHLQQQDMTLYYRDVYDHIVRQYETADSLRDLLTSAMDVYLSTVSNRLNQTTKALTVIASLFLPLSFLTGFYGMNFAY